jgi:transcriptional regulator with XRE-family HTH domain
MSTPEATALTLGQVIGENLKRHREGMRWTQHEMARHLQRNGLNWARGQVAAIEAGNRESVSFEAMVVLAAALGVSLAGLLAGDGDVQLTPDTRQTRAGLRALVAGPLDMDLDPWDRVQVGQRAAQLRYEADLALAKRLGVSAQDVMTAARGLFNGRTLTEERDLRVKVLTLDDETMSIREQQAHRGHITRELSAEIEKALQRGEE